MSSDARALAAATPVGRDRYVDLLRVVALAAVMVGHFIMVGVVVLPDGSVEVTNALTVITWAQLLTWVLQVMPIFFAVGGFAHAVALASVERRGGSYADFVVARVDRLLRPTAVFVAVGMSVGVVVELAGRLDTQASMILRVIAQPLWFVGIYLAVVGLSPLMLRAHRRWGVRVLVVLTAATALDDLARLHFGAPEIIGYLNFAFVWLAVHQCGFFYADGTPQRKGRPFAAGLAVGGLAATTLLVAFGPYPRSMVSLPGETVSNMTPPSLALLTLSVWLMGLALLLRGPMTRLLDRPGPWTATVAANGMAMTAFLWHLTVIVGVSGLLVLLHVPVFPPIGTARWWLLRLPLFLLMAAVLAGVVAVFRRFERPQRWPIPDPAHRRRLRDPQSAVGLVLALFGILGFSVAGFAGILSLRTATLVVVPMSSAVSAFLLATGIFVVRHAAGASGHSPRHSTPDSSPQGRQQR